MKTYQKPEVDILDIMSEDLLATSPQSTAPITEGGGDLNTVPTTSVTSGNLSRQNDMWETYEEPEY